MEKIFTTHSPELGKVSPWYVRDWKPGAGVPVSLLVVLVVRIVVGTSKLGVCLKKLGSGDGAVVVSSVTCSFTYCCLLLSVEQRETHGMGCSKCSSRDLEMGDKCHGAAKNTWSKSAVESLAVTRKPPSPSSIFETYC